jgi:hypothetical protein
LNLTTTELIRLLEYIPKETAPDLHEKIVGRLTSRRYYEKVMSVKRGPDRDEAEELFVNSLSSYEFDCWDKYIMKNTSSLEEE